MHGFSWILLLHSSNIHPVQLKFVCSLGSKEFSPLCKELRNEDLVTLTRWDHYNFALPGENIPPCLKARMEKAVGWVWMKLVTVCQFCIRKKNGWNFLTDLPSPTLFLDSKSNSPFQNDFLKGFSELFWIATDPHSFIIVGCAENLVH